MMCRTSLLPWKVVLLAVAVFLHGCAGSKDRRALREELVQQAGWESRMVGTPQFEVAVSAPGGRTGSTMIVYLEGDGRAYLNATMASTDPTPSDPVALRMALSDPASGPLLYIARPCQYTLPAHGRGCGKQYWTRERYAPAVVDSIATVLDIEKKRVGASRLILVGYSGGGALAVLLAQRRSDVGALVTAAANLDTGFWTVRDGLAPLDGSLDPADLASRIESLPQVHLAGSDDRVVGPDVTRAFLQRMRSDARRNLEIIPGFDHVCCWAQQWRALMQTYVVKRILWPD